MAKGQNLKFSSNLPKINSEIKTLSDKTKAVGQSLLSSLTSPIIKTIVELGKLSNSTTTTGSGMTNLTTETQNLGVIIANETSSISSLLADKLAIIQQKTDELKGKLSEGLFPAFEQIAQIVNDNVVPILQGATDKFSGLSEEHKNLITNITLVITTIAPLIPLFGQLVNFFTTVTGVINFAKLAVTRITESFSLAELGIGALIAIVAMALLQNEEFKEILLELTEIFFTLLKPVMKFAMILIDGIMPVIKILIQLLHPLITLLVQLAKVVLDVLIPPFNIFIDVINIVIGAINLLLKGLKFLTFGAIDLQIPTLEKVDLASSRKASQEVSSNVNNNNTSNVYHNSFNIANDLDVKKVASALAMSEGKETN